MATKAELEARLAKRNEPRPTVHTAVAGPVIATGCLLTVAILYLAAQQSAGPEGTFAPEWLAIPPLVAWLVAYFGAEAYLAVDGPVVAAQGLSAAAGATAALWLVWTGRVGPEVTWPYLVMWGGLVTLLWAAVLWTADRRASQGPVVAVTGTVDQAMPWAQLLKRATQGRVVLTGADYHRAGVKLTVETARVEDEDEGSYDVDVTFDDFAGCAPRFASLAASEYRRRAGERLPLNCARPEEGRDDAEFILNVSLRDVFGGKSDYVPAAVPQDIMTPKDLGEYEDASRILVTLLSGHGKIVGAEGSGKTVEANNWIARTTECSNALAWVCATDKLIPLIWPWLRSWFAGQSVKPCLDYVAGLNIQNVLGMLADAYKLCCERNARNTDVSKLHPTTAEPAVIVYVEEMSHMMEFKNTIVTHDGMTCDASTLIMMITRAGRAAGVRVVLLSQTALNAAAGDCAAEIIRNVRIRVCLLTMEAHDGWRTIPALNNVDTTKLTANTKIVQPSTEVARAMPGKAPYLDGTNLINPIAIRNAGWRPAGVEAESNLGKRYADRWNPARHPELARAVTKHGLTWRAPDMVVGAQTPPTVEPLAEEKSMSRWTGTDTAQAHEAYDETLSRRGQKTFYVPGGDEALAKLKAIAQDIIDNPHGGVSSPGPPEVGEEPRPLPTQLGAVIDWLDEQEAAGTLADFYLTAHLAEGIGYPEPARLGRLIRRDTGLRSRQATAGEGGGGRNGYDVRELREAATRIRFGL
jgi:hypothetical protein